MAIKTTKLERFAKPKNSKVGRVLVVGPGQRGRGGIAAVIRMHQSTPTWLKRKTRLLPTFDDRSALHKIRSALIAYLRAPFLLAQADLLHVHLAAQTSVLRKLPILVMAKLMNKPFIVHVHAPSIESLFTNTPTWAMRFVFRSATRVIALSQRWADAFESYEPLTRTVVLANPVQISAPNQLDPTAPPVILFVGKLESRKGYADLLAAAAEILPRFPQAQFWFAGHGELDAAQRIAEQLGIARSVRFLGWVDGKDLDAVYRQATLVTLPSYAEGVPMAIIEAMGRSIPVVCTPVGGLPELIHDEESGLFVQPGDISGLAHQIGRLLHEPQFATTIGAAGRLAVQQQCSIEEVSRALDAIYTEVLHEGGPRRG